MSLAAPVMSAALLSKSGSLLAIYRCSRCGFSCAWARIRCTVDLLSANSLASFRQDQCVLPSPGFCCTRRITRAPGLQLPDASLRQHGQDRAVFREI